MNSMKVQFNDLEFELSNVSISENDLLFLIFDKPVPPYFAEQITEYLSEILGFVPKILCFDKNLKRIEKVDSKFCYLIHSDSLNENVEKLESFGIKFVPLREDWSKIPTEKMNEAGWYHKTQIEKLK